jgi:hypothetical protein
MRRTLLAPILLGLLAAPLPAQSTGDATAYAALVSTPVGTLPPLLSAPMLNRAMPSPDIAIRYGHISFTNGSSNAFDARLGIPAGPSVVFGVNAGYQTYSCDTGECNGHFIGGANVEGRLTTIPLGSYADAARITIGLNGEAGIGHRSGTTAGSLTGGLPFALVSGPPTIRIAPFLTPGIGWGRESDGVSHSGTRFLLAGGVMFQSTTNGIGATVGFQKVFIDNGDTMLGVAW